MTASARLAILGGSSPSAVALIDALAAPGRRLPLVGLALHGRDEDRLGAVERYARARLAGLGAQVRATRRLDEALEGATAVIHQIRYGGMQARAEDEAFAEANGIAADETCGPAALRCALRMAPPLTELARALRATCPDAWVINLANPLGVSTAILAGLGIRCVGVCGLPGLTVQQAADLLEVPVGALEWSYDGLNHRGFLHDLRIGGRDQLARLLRRLGAGTINGIPRMVIQALGAIPLRDFRLLGRGYRPSPGRAAFLEDLSHQVFQELRTDPLASPPSLSRREARWYPDPVVPTLLALGSTAPERLVVNLPRADGLVVERRADVSAAGIQPVDGAAPNHQVAAWLDVFAGHERAILRAVRDPGLDTLTAALTADPLLTIPDVKPLASALDGYARQQEDRRWALT
jgi:6-phospho-beta-glucosidase